MNYFTREKFLKWVVVLLVALNLFSMGALWITKAGPGFFGPDHRRGHRPPPPPHRQPLPEQLGFDPAQTQTFESLKSAHHKETGAILYEIRREKDAMFKSIGLASGDSLAQIHAEQIGKLQTQLELATYSHFEEVRELCNPEQKPVFDEVIEEAVKPMGPPPPPHHRGEGPPPPPREGRRSGMKPPPGGHGPGGRPPGGPEGGHRR